jgi:hypothetical protein
MCDSKKLSGNQSLYWYFGVQELLLVKNLTPSWASPVRKRVWAQFVKCKNLCEGLLDYEAPQFTSLTKDRNDGGCRHSRSASTPCLQYWPNEKILVLFFLPLGKAQSILALAFRRLPFVSFTAILDLRLQCALALLFYLSMLSSHSDRIVRCQQLSCALVLTSLWIQLHWGVTLLATRHIGTRVGC